MFKKLVIKSLKWALQKLDKSVLFEYSGQIYDYKDDIQWVAYRWHADDVKTMNPDLTDEDCWNILIYLLFDHDASIGVNWEVIEQAIDK